MRLILKFNILRLMVVFLAMMAVGTMHSETVSQKQAKKIAEMFFNEARGMKMSAPEYVYNGKSLSTGRFMIPFYLFNHSSGGFVIVAADNKAFPILAFDLERKFDKKNIGQDMLGLLSMYAKHIEYVRYDSQVPESAIRAWQNLPEYIHELLNEKADTEDVVISTEEASMNLNNILYTDDSEIASQTSISYYPEQWSALINEEFQKSGNVALGLIENEEILPMVVNGRKGEYYRIELDGTNSGWYRLMPTEIMSFGQIALLENIPNITEEYAEEEPFSYYESYVAEFEAERRRTQSAIENANIVTTPIIRNNGGGHYMIDMPEDIRLVRVFNLSGAVVWQATYNSASSVSINLSSVSTGFYFAVMSSESGQTYSVKLFR